MTITLTRSIRDDLGQGCRADTARTATPAVGAGISGDYQPTGSRPFSHPVLIDGCFGWLHAASSPDQGAMLAPSDVAVVLCPALGWDGLYSHHGFRLLADQFAVAGIPALRLQYPGTGDSRDLPADGSAEPWHAWQQSLHRAADWMRATTGARRLILLGLRLGATLATVVAEDRTDIEALILLAPVLRGKSYVRQLEMEARLEGGAAGIEAAEPNGGLAFHELRFGPQTVAELSAVDLRRVKLRAGVQVALFPQTPTQLANTCAQAWTAAGLLVHSGPFDGLEPLLQEAIHVEPPLPDFTRVLAWTSRCVTAGLASVGPAPTGRRQPLPFRVSLKLDGCIEEPVRFGPNKHLFGVLCRPASGAKLAVVITNTGRDPHFGIARFGVEFARCLAREGFTSLRMDFAGLGDSLAASPGPDSPLSSLFDTDRSADIGAAIDLLEATGYTAFAVHGLCSGAYHAFQAAQKDARIGSLLLLNLPVFEWRGGDSVRKAIWTSAPTRRIVQKMTSGATWRRILRGQAEIRPFLQAQATRLLGGVRRWLPFLPSAKSFPERAMTALAARGARSLFLYSVGDPGLDAVEQAFGPGRAGLCTQPNVELQIITGVDHVLSGRHMRERVANLMVTFLAAHEGQGATDDDTLDHFGPDDDRRPFAEADVGAIA